VSSTPDTPGVPATVYIVIVNWNGWRDTLECLESVSRLRYSRYRVVVCDNGSTDGSLEQVRAWAEGGLEPSVDEQHVLSSLVRPPVAKPVRYSLLDRAGAEAGGSAHDRPAPPLVLVDTGANLGFAGGCNVGIRYAMRQPDCAYIWLLNNDTVVDSEALTALVRRLRAQPSAGQCGSRLIDYRDPAVVQTLGGERYNKWLGRIRPIGAGRRMPGPVDSAWVERRMSYVSGASLCVTRAFVEQTGLLDESYFLYYEELDWTARAGGRFTLAYADDSVVYHKGGASTGCDRSGARRNASGDFFVLRNRLRFTRRHAPEALPTVLLGMGAAVVNRIRRRQFGRIPTILRIVSSRDTYRAGPPPVVGPPSSEF
jgi:GT2 family glycosyltransferase